MVKSNGFPHVGGWLSIHFHFGTYTQECLDFLDGADDYNPHTSTYYVLTMKDCNDAGFLRLVTPALAAFSKRKLLVAETCDAVEAVHSSTIFFWQNMIQKRIGLLQPRMVR